MIKAVIDTNVIVSAYITKNLEAATSKELCENFNTTLCQNHPPSQRKK